MEKLKIALQKSGRLHEESLNILRDCGFNIHLGDKLKTKTLKLDVFSLRDDDIPKYVQEGIADIGIVGKNVVCEQKKHSLIKSHLGFGSCRLSFAVPKYSIYKSAKDLNGKSIATSHPNLLKMYLKKFKVSADIHYIGGSVEIAPNIDVADAICDLVSSGSTLDLNNLKEIEQIFFSEAVLICSPNLNYKQKNFVKNLIFLLQAIKRARYSKSILFNVPNKNLDKIISYLENLKCTNILPIASSIYSSCTYVRVMVPDIFLWCFIEKLKRNSVKIFLVLRLQKGTLFYI